MALNVYGDISPRTAAYAVAKMLSVGQVNTVTERFGQVDPHPKKNSLTRKYRRFEPLPWATAPLAEGVTPAGDEINVTDVTITLNQFGSWVKVTDVIVDTHEDPVLEIMATRCGEQMAETVELIRLGALTGGTNVAYASGVASRLLVNSTITHGDLRKITRSFKRNRAKEISRIVSASALISTEGVEPAFFAIASTDLESDIRELKGFTPVVGYSQAAKALPGEIGKCENIRFILTPLLTPWLAAATSISIAQTTYLANGVAVAGYPDVYPVLIFAQDAYAICPMQGGDAVTPAVHNPQVSSDDPLAQRGFVSWKTYQGAGILQQLWMARLEVAATANPS